jgi:CRISPR-associated protein Csd1
MMLQALIAYAERENLGDADFEYIGVRWLVVLDAYGNIAGDPIPLAENPGEKKLKPKRLLRPKSDPDFVSHGRSYFLCDSLERSTVFVADDEKREKRRVNHAYFVGLIEEAARDCPSESARLLALVAFLRDDTRLAELHTKLLRAKAKTSDNVTFSVSGQSLLESAELKKWWRRKNQRQRDEQEQFEATCLATGQHGPICRTAGFIKLLGEDTKLISFNKECPAFESFGFSQAANAPVSIVAEEKFRSALNNLIEKSRSQGLVFNDTVYLHWTRETQTIDPFDLLTSPDPEAVAALVKSVQVGRRYSGLEAGDYYALSVSANGARVVVRDWLVSTVHDVQRAVARWFSDLTVADQSGGDPRSNFSLWSLLATLVPRKEGKPDFGKLASQTAAELLHAALNGGPLPQPVLAAAIRRHHLENNKTVPARLALIKACLLRSPNRNEIHTMKECLDPESKDCAYLCGQLFAVMGRLQLLALGKIGASIAERTYGGVATRPATTFGPLFTKLPAHLKKANARFPGSGTNKQKELEHLSVRIEAVGGIPQTLSLEEQGRFALGYYCQLAQYRADREEAITAEAAESIVEEAN